MRTPQPSYHHHFRRRHLPVCFGSKIAFPWCYAILSDVLSRLFRAATSISYVDIQKLLNDCRDGDACALEKVVFTVESGETGDAVFKSGARLPITGIPEDNPTNDSSPYKLVAKLRDAKVPYTFPFSEGLAKYRSKSNAEKTAPNQISAPFLALPKLPF